ncbi:MAG: ATP-binding cassette domain-containing protein [Erysipelothrix sp.]|nr:ATP-binding cassette domain-containing protein [Erysipelothrix sp.]
MISITNITKTFDSKNNSFTALHNVSFTVQTGEMFGIVGESGAGKSTLLRCIINLEIPDSGTILFDDKPMDKNMLRETATIFQNYNLLNNKTAFDNVALPLKIRNTYHEQSVADALKFVGLESRRDYYPAQLSGGEKQRLAIARAIVSKPKFLICDEPTSALDRKTSQDMIELLNRINTELNTTILIVTHELSVAKALCSRVAILDKGHCVDVINVDRTLMDDYSINYIDHVKEVLR